MADISIQFHALPEELLGLVKAIVNEFHLHVVAVKAFPFEAIEVSPDKLDEIFAETSPYRELMFTLNVPILSVKSNMDFLDKNPGALRLLVERKSKEGLRQSLLGARTDAQAVLSVWKKIAKRLKDMTQAGVVIINPKTGASAHNRIFRYSRGAKALAASGVPMLPIAGGNRIEFSGL